MLLVRNRVRFRKLYITCILIKLFQEDAEEILNQKLVFTELLIMKIDKKLNIIRMQLFIGNEKQCHRVS